MIRTGPPHASSDGTEEAPTPAGQPGAEQGGEEPSGASRKPTKDSEFLWMDWHKMWEQRLGPVTINAHRSPGSLREVKAAWLREQGDWNGANTTSEGWILLEGRAREIARAEARLGLQQARKQGSINDYLQSLRHRGHVGLANIGLAVLSTNGTLGGEPDKRQHQDQVNDWLGQTTANVFSVSRESTKTLLVVYRVTIACLILALCLPVQTKAIVCAMQDTRVTVWKTIVLHVHSAKQKITVVASVLHVSKICSQIPIACVSA